MKKKIFSLIAMAAMTLGVNAQDWNATNAEALPNGTKILDNDFVKINTAVQDSETALIKDENDNPDPKTFGGYTFTKYVNIRVTDAPKQDNNWEGTAYDGATPLGISLIVTAKQNTDVTLYYKHGDGKTVSCVDQTTGKSVAIAETAVTGIASYYTGVFNFLEGHTYTIYAKGGTTGLNGISTVATPAAEEITDGTTVTTTWTMNDPEAISSTSSVATAITDTKVTLGSGLSYQGSVTWGGQTYTKLQPTPSDKGKNEYANAKELGKYIDFQVTPSGKYQITKVEFDIIKIGTGDPNIFVDLIEGDGSATTVGDNLTIRRNNDTDATDIHQSIEAKTAVSDQPVSLRIYVGKCANNKQVGIANVVITGTIATPASVPVTISAGGYSSFSSSSALDFSSLDGLEAYVVSAVSTTAVTLTKVAEAPANTGLILKGTSGASYNIPILASATAIETNYLKAAVAATEIADDAAYGLKDGKFVKLAAGTIPAGKAYLLASDIPASAAELTLDFGNATGINTVNGSGLTVNGEFYNLAGQRVAQPTKGLYIVNGKKYMVK